jgi:hypothetical protein
VSWAPIEKDVSAWPVQPNMPGFEETCATFSWGKVRSELGGSADCFNIAHLAVACLAAMLESALRGEQAAQLIHGIGWSAGVETCADPCQ